MFDSFSCAIKQGRTGIFIVAWLVAQGNNALISM
jgi:protein-tyrosine phosphatase